MVLGHSPHSFRSIDMRLETDCAQPRTRPVRRTGSHRGQEAMDHAGVIFSLLTLIGAAQAACQVCQ